MESQNIFTGKFKVLAVYCNVQEQGWTLFKRYGHKSFRWEFIQEKEIPFPDGTVAYEGRLKEHFKDSPKEQTEFAYYPSDRQLYIDRSDYAPDGFCNICINDRYRVEHIGKNDYWLYDLEDVEKEPDDYRYRIKIRAIPIEIT